MAQISELERGVKFRPKGSETNVVVLYVTQHPIDPDESTYITAYQSDGEWHHESLWDPDIELEKILSHDALTDVPWTIESEALSKYSVFTEREADVAVLRWRYNYQNEVVDRKEIASTLGIMPNTVDNTWQSARDRLREVASTPVHIGGEK